MREGARISGIVDRPDPILAHFSVVVDWKPVMASGGNSQPTTRLWVFLVG